MMPPLFGSFNTRRFSSRQDRESRAADVVLWPSFNQTRQLLPVETDVMRNDIVVVVEPGRRLFGKLCMVTYLDSDANTVELEVISRIDSSADSGCDWDGRGIQLQQKKKHIIHMRTCDVRRVALPLTRTLPDPPNELDFVAANYSKIDVRGTRYSEARLSAMWNSLSEDKQQQWQTTAALTQTTRKLLLRLQHRVMLVLAELMSRAPRHAPTSYFLFVQQAKTQGCEPKALPELWRELGQTEKQSYAERARGLAAREKSQLKMFVEVACGHGWSHDRAAFFPASATRCLRTLLLCQRRRGSLANHVSANIWKSHVFPFVPFHWFIDFEDEAAAPLNSKLQHAIKKACLK
eukprot:TRINITY_DN96684_c0_g1_i1.p1 TRINITY_DN96684_c0_g1~~TRINITY_DN96684_c0_g1_i1.p1  ORF type:complete len:349 (+),score=37.07 TRINITY_DN96684_c0_g1_i1:57-1103(+)